MNYTVVYVLNNMPLCPQLWEENEEVEIKRAKKKTRNSSPSNCVCKFRLLIVQWFPMLEITDDTIADAKKFAARETGSWVNLKMHRSHDVDREHEKGFAWFQRGNKWNLYDESRE